MNFRKDELVKGSIILFLMVGIFNVVNYAFHFAMARMLDPGNYAILVVLTSVGAIFSVPSEAIQTISSKYSSKFAKNAGKLKDLMIRGMKKALKLSSLCYLLYIPVALFLSFFLDIKFILLMLTGLIVFGLFTSPILRGVLQGKKRFIGLGLSLNVESLMKVALGVLLVYLVKDVYGAVVAIVLSTVIGFLFTLSLLKGLLKEKRENVDMKGIYAYGFTTFLLFLSIVLILSLDVILAKRFFSAEIAGQYAVASLLGKTLFFGTSGIGKAMFPIATGKQQHERRGILKKATILTIVICAGVLLAFAIAPELITRLMFGSKYLVASSIILYTGIAFSLLSLTNLVVLHKLSHGKVKNPYYLFIFVLVEILLLWGFSQSLLSYSIGLCIANLICLAGSLFLKSEK